MRRPATLRSPRAFTTGAGALLLAAWGLAHVPLLNPSNGEDLHWNSSSVEVVIGAEGSDDIDDDSHVPALRGAIAAWNDAADNDIALVEDTTESQRERSDWQSSGVHLLWFDESNSSGYFPTGSGIVAVTPIFFTSSGRITDADVLFNGKGFRFTTSGESGAFDVSDVATHELGHLLGLDHSVWAGASMYPYVDPRVILHRSLSTDDVHGLRDAYPASGLSRLRGRVLRAEDDTQVAGAHVVARDTSGRPVAGTLTGSTGVFRLDGLPPGTYTLYASPLGQPVSAANLGEGWDVDTDFQSTILGSATFSGASEEVDLGEVTVDLDTAVSLGRASDDYPLRAVIGESTNFSIRGSGLVSGGTLTCSDPDIDLEVISMLGIMVQFSLDVPAGETAGHVDLMYTSAEGDRSILTAGIELTPPDPEVVIVSPASGDNDGGSTLTIVGSNFRPGARVVIGDSLYEDGVGGCQVVDSETITLTTSEMIGGLHDVVVIDATGVEGRLVEGFRATATPVIAATFPTVGSSEGGTRIHLTGDDFVDGMTVTIDGVEQSQVDVRGPDLAVVTTEAAAVGGPYVVTVTNPSGGVASTAFTYVAGPDPLVANLAPDSGPSSGGTEVTLFGTNFDSNTRVRFAGDGSTGVGGDLVDVTFVSSTELLVTSPSSGAGMADIVVFDETSGQASSLLAAFEYEGSDDDDDGAEGPSFGCAGVSELPPGASSRMFWSSSWLWLLLGLAWWRSRREPEPVPVRVRGGEGRRAGDDDE